MLNFWIRQALTAGALFLPFLCFASPGVASAEQLKVYWAGFSFLGEQTATETLYPYSEAISQEQAGGVSLLNQELGKIVQAAKPPNYTIEARALADLEEQEGLVMALVLDREDVVVNQIREDHQIIIDLNAQVLVFDFIEKRIVAAFPMAVQLIDVVEGGPGPTEAHIRNLIRNIYFGKPSRFLAPLLPEFAVVLNRQRIQRKYDARVKVAAVKFPKELQKFFPENMTEDLIANALGKLFAKNLSNNQSVSILPDSKGQAISGTMALKFSTGEALNLQLPQADFTIEAKLTQLKRVLLDKQHDGEAYAYGAYLHVKAEGLTTWIDATFKQGVGKIVPARQKGTVDWPVYWEVISELMDGLTKQMQAKPNKKWLKKHAVTDGSKKQLQKLAKQLEACK
jgi:hypothetical protein